MNNNGCIIPEIDEQNIGVQQENATFLVIGDEAYTSEIIEEYNRNAAAKTEEFNTNATNKTNDFNTNYNNKLEVFNSNAVTKTEDFDSHVTAQTTNFNNNAETATTNFNKNAAQQTDEFNKNAMSYSQSIEENKKNIASTSNELYHLKTDILETGESSGNNIHLEDSAWAEMQEIKVDGVCEQETTKGNQLIDFESIGSISCDVKFKNDTLEITSNKSYSRASKNITELLQNNVGKVLNFTFERIDFSKTLGGRIQINILKKDGTHLYQGLVETSGKKVSYTIPNDFSDITSIVLEIYSNNTSKNSDTELTILKPLLYFENNNSYEPYTGGQPSPSPDYPQEIKTITGSLKVTSCGKNLFDIDKYPILSRTAYSDGNLKEWNEYTGIRSYFPLKENETYTLSNSLNEPIYYGLVFYDENKQVISYINTPTRIFTTPAKCRYIRFSFNRTEKIIWVQIEQANTASEYESYVESQIQAKLPEGEFIGKLDDTYKDTLRAEYFPEEGQYHLMLDKKVGKYVFTGAEDFTIINSSAGITQFRYLNSKIAKLSDSNYVRAISNYFTHNYIWGNSWSKDNSLAHLVGFSAIVFYSSNFSTVSDFKQFLKDKYDNSNPVVVYYLLAKPYTLDLGVIDMPLTYDEITNIFTDSDLLPNITAKYYRNFTATIQNLQVNNDTLKNELSNIESRLTALESANTNIESRLTTLENANKNVADSNPTEESEVTE